MLSALHALLTLLVGSAVATTLLAFVLNTRSERLNTLRDHITQSFEETRSDIREAVSAGVAYWTCSHAAALPDLEVKVLLYESDVRSALAAIRGMCAEEELAAVPALQDVEADFLDALTGGNFASTPFRSDVARARQIIGYGTRLRSELSRLRRHQLSKANSVFLRGTGLAILFLAVVTIVYAAGLYDGVVIEDMHRASITNQPACGHTIDIRSGSQVVTVQAKGAIRICSKADR
jgi:hypothetical protein